MEIRLKAKFLVIVPCLTSVLYADPKWEDTKWNVFINGIHQVETSGKGIGQVGDNGKALGPLQIHKECFQDAVEYNPDLKSHKYEECLVDLKLSAEVCKAYVQRYLKEGASLENGARLWNAGPNWKKKLEKTKEYVRKFLKAISE